MTERLKLVLDCKCAMRKYFSGEKKGILNYMQRECESNF